MSTFNGWPILPLPSYPPAPATIEYTDLDVVGVTTNPFSQQQQFFNWGTSWMEWTVSYPLMNNATFNAWRAWFASLQGTTNVFQLGDPVNTAPSGTANGSGLTVSGSNQTGYTLVTSGGSGTLEPGDWLQIGYRLYQNINAVSLGSATLTIWPQLRESPAGGTAISLTNTQGLWRLKENTRKYSVATNKYYSLRFDIREAL